MIKTILLVEKDPDIRDVMTYILEEDGYMVRSISSLSAVNTNDDEAPELVLVDEWQQGELEHRVCRAFKSVARFQHIPVVILSTANDIEHLVKACSADGYIRKPFNLNELLNKVHNYLD